MEDMYGMRSETNGELQGWFQAPRFDLYVWIANGEVTHLQVCAGSDVVDWKPTGLLPTGQLRGRGGGIGVLAAREDTIMGDRDVSAERVARIVAALRTADLPPDVRDFALAAVQGQAPTVPAATVEAEIRALKTVR